MSMSPTASNSLESPVKRRRTSVDMSQSNPPLDSSGSASQPSPSHVPKRGARACTSCRKGKNRCEGEAPCRRCLLSGTPCVFEKPEKKNPQALTGPSVERLSRLEGQYLVMQSQMIGMQSSLDRILSAVQTQAPQNGGMSQQGPFYSPNMGPVPGMPRDPLGYVGPPRNGLDMITEGQPRSRFPSHSNFVSPLHKHPTYSIDSGTARSPEDDSEEALRRPAMGAPIEALQGLANAAAEAAAAPSSPSHGQQKRKKGEPVPSFVFPHVVEKGLVSDTEAKELYHIFFAGCHLFMPLFDPLYDTYESLMERSPWTFNVILAIAAKIRSGNGPLSPTFFKCMEEAHGIARSLLFGAVVPKEVVQGMLLLAAWGMNGWLLSGYAMRMALDLGLYRALEKLTEQGNEEERDLVVDARAWLCLYWFDHQLSLATGRPIILRDESSIRNCRVLLSHPVASPTDVRLIAQVELVLQKTQIYETLSTSVGQVNHNTLAFIRRAGLALDNWWAEFDEIHRKAMDEDSVLRKILASELHATKLWLVCVALRGVSWDKMPFEQRELAFQAKDSALNCLSIFLTSPAFRAALRYAAHDTLVTTAFSGLFLLKIAHLFPAELDLVGIIAQVEQLAQLLSEVSAERYALAVRIMLASVRRKTDIMGGMPNSVPSMPEGVIVPPTPSFVSPGQPFTTEELGLAWPSDRVIIHPSSIPLWLQEQSFADLGLPDGGTDSIFSQIGGLDGWPGDFAPIPDAW